MRRRPSIGILEFDGVRDAKLLSREKFFIGVTADNVEQVLRSANQGKLGFGFDVQWNNLFLPFFNFRFLLGVGGTCGRGVLVIKLLRLLSAIGVTDSLIIFSGATRLMGTTALTGAFDRPPNDSLTRILKFLAVGGAICFFRMPYDDLILDGESFAGLAFDSDLRRVNDELMAVFRVKFPLCGDGFFTGDGGRKLDVIGP